MVKKVLIITYYWPPVGGSGVQRWLKMSRYLKAYGWEPVIYTPENPSFGVVDESQLKDVPQDLEVIKIPIWEPYRFFAKVKGKKGIITASDIRITQEKSMLDRLFLWLRANLFIPDPRIFWVKPSVKFLPDIIHSNTIDAVITTGPPHSLHLIGRKLKKKTGIKWIADFRDPWTEWDLYEEFPMTKWARKKQKDLERKVLQEADEVLTINKYFRARFEKLGGRPVNVVSNGFDEADFKDFHKRKTEEFIIRHIGIIDDVLTINNYFRSRFEKLGGRPVNVVSNGFDEADFKDFHKRKTEKFIIRYIGIIDEMRDSSGFIEAFKWFVADHSGENIKMEFIGNVAETFQEKVRADSAVSSYVTFKPYQPHSEIIRLYEDTDVLLLVLAKTKHAAGNTTGKIYEYLASEARILALGPLKGEVADILNYTDAGKVVPHDNVKGIREVLEQYFKMRHLMHKNKHVKEFSRRAQSGKVAAILDKCFQGKMDEDA